MGGGLRGRGADHRRGSDSIDASGSRRPAVSPFRELAAKALPHLAPVLTLRLASQHPTSRPSKKICMIHSYIMGADYRHYSRDLSELDEVFSASRRWLKRPGHRRRFLELLDQPIELTTIRLLHAVDTHVGDDPSIGDMASALGIDPSSASRFVDRAVERGEVARHICPDDRRRVRLALTERGRATLADVTRARQAILSEVLQDWAVSDIRQLTALLRRLGEGFDLLESTR